MLAFICSFFVQKWRILPFDIKKIEDIFFYFFESFCELAAPDWGLDHNKLLKTL
jgi:hypothetical protein